MEFRRNPRLYKEQTTEMRTLRPLPVTPVKQKTSIFSRALYPMIMVLAYGLMYDFKETSPTMLLFPLLMLIPSVVIPLMDDRRNWKQAMKIYKDEIASYHQYLDELDLEFTQIKQSVQLWNALNFPGPVEELERCKHLDATLWCKRAEYSDFMTICLGTYSATFPVQLVIDYQQMVLHRDDALKKRIYDLQRKYDTIENAPLLLNLLQYPCLGIHNNGDFDSTQEYLASILLSALYSYGYDEMKLIVIAKKGKYQWTRWLPHCWDEDKKIRYFASTDSEKSTLLSYLLKICQDRAGANQIELPYYFILVEDVAFFEKHEIKEYFNQMKNNVSMSVIFISDSKGLPSQAESILNIDKTNSVFTNASMFGLNEVAVVPRKTKVSDVEALARFFSSIQLTDDISSNELPSLITMFELYGEKNLSPDCIALDWQKNHCYIDGIHAVVGMKSPTEVMDLDMSDEKDGAHMLVAGTTGSGKSEFLQTFVLALALRYSPDEVSFVFIDFKEGGMSESFKDLPHNAGTLTNIEDEIDYFSGRAITMLTNERKRRAKLLEAYGQKINRYHEAYHKSNNKGVPLPHLFIVIDEFAEVIAQCSEFRDMIVSLSRVGRSLGIHLILATQSPSQSVDSQIWSNSNCKVCLKVLNEEESNAVLKVKDAAHIQTRGRAYCLTGSRSGLIEFQTAWSGAPTSAEFLATKIEVIKGVNERFILSKKINSSYTASTQLTQLCVACNMVKYYEKIAEPHSVLTPSLSVEIKLKFDEHTKSIPAHLPKAYIGIGDFTNDHKQKPVSICFGNGNNHIMIAGSPNSGRSHVVAQLIKQFEFNCNTSDIQFYLIQYGSKSLKTYENSPIVAEYITNLVTDISEPEEKIRRIPNFIYDIIKARQSEKSNEKLPKLVFIVDGWNQLIAGFDEYPEELLSIMSLNPAQYGVHFILITNVDQIGYKLIPYFDTKVFMKYEKSMMHIEEFSFEGSILPRKGRALYFDRIVPYAIEIQTYDEIDTLPTLVDRSLDCKKLHIPTFRMVYAQKGSYARALYSAKGGSSILLGLCKDSLEWIELSFDYYGVAVSYVDILPKDAFIRYIMHSFSQYHVVLIEEESRRHCFEGNIITNNDPDYLLEWAKEVEDNSIIIIDYPGVVENNSDDYPILKMHPWQECLRDKMATGKIMLIWIEHVSDAGTHSFFSDAICSYQKRIAMGGKGDRHPYFNERFAPSNIYLDSTEALVSLKGSDWMVIRTMMEL